MGTGRGWILLCGWCIACGAGAVAQSGGGTPGPGAVAPADDAGSAQLRKGLIEHIARERRARDLPRLETHPELDAVARAHSLDMLRHDFIAHESPRTGTPADRVRGAGLNAWLVRENVARGYDAEDIHQGLMESPGHRANILAERAERLGVGVVPVPNTTPRAYLVTQLFASLAKEINPRKARRDVLARVQAARSAAGHGELKTPKALMSAAQQAAERFFAEQLGEKELLETALGPELFPEAERVGGSVTVLHSLSQLDAGALAGRPEARWLGLGLAQGSREDSGPGTIAIVALYGLP